MLFCVTLAAWWRCRCHAVRPARAATALLGLLLAVHSLAAMQAARHDLVEPFSQGRAVAAFLTPTRFAELPILVEPDYAALPIAGYLNRFYTALEG